jgi:hypothetical protein
MLLLGSSMYGLFKRRQFEPEVILLAVDWYLRFSLSYRDVEELLVERGLHADHITVWGWVQRYALELERRLRERLMFSSSIMFSVCSVFSIRPNSAIACASRVGLSPTCRVRMMPVAGTRPSKSESVSRNMSSQCGEMRCRWSRCGEMTLSFP